MINFQVKTFSGINYILVDTPARGNYVGLVADYERQPIPMPNFKGTGMALKGILKKGETINAWHKRTGNR